MVYTEVSKYMINWIINSIFNVDLWKEYLIDDVSITES
jgi:hypothetical protein